MQAFHDHKWFKIQYDILLCFFVVACSGTNKDILLIKNVLDCISPLHCNTTEHCLLYRRQRTRYTNNQIANFLAAVRPFNAYSGFNRHISSLVKFATEKPVISCSRTRVGMGSIGHHTSPFIELQQLRQLSFDHEGYNSSNVSASFLTLRQYSEVNGVHEGGINHHTFPILLNCRDINSHLLFARGIASLSCFSHLLQCRNAINYITFTRSIIFHIFPSVAAREEGDEKRVQVSRNVGQLHHQDVLDEAAVLPTGRQRPQGPF